MALEATLVYETQTAIPFTCADGAGIEKGTVLKLTDPMTVAASDGDVDIIAGIAAEEKIASDGKTTIAVYTRGYFKVTSGGTIAVGAALITNASSGAANEVITAPVNAENILGRSMETATDAQTLLIELAPYTANLAA